MVDYAEMETISLVVAPYLEKSLSLTACPRFSTLMAIEVSSVIRPYRIFVSDFISSSSSCPVSKEIFVWGADVCVSLNAQRLDCSLVSCGK